MALPADTRVMVLVDSADSVADNALEKETAEYYQGQTPGDSEDNAWGEGLSSDSRHAWDDK
jgi:hypothetical protein